MQLAPEELQWPANVGQLVSTVHDAPEDEQVPGTIGQSAVLWHTAAVMLH